ncbi:MAG: IS110 family transposase [Alphaproteobacteria bacterium]|nr:MAG: IS110 family transposase [Alphaproteobacteria bacterium]
MRYIGIDLHTNSFTLCILEAGCAERIQTLPVQKGGLEILIKDLQPDDEVAIEATGNSTWFREQLLPHVARVLVIAPWQFEVIRRSVKKTDKHDARAIAFFLSKDMIPEARLKSAEHTQLSSLIATRDQLVKLRVSLLNKMHGLFVRHGLKIKKEVLTSKVGFKRAVSSHAWDVLEQVEIEVIADQLESIHQSCARLKTEITSFAKALPGYENLISIKGIGPLSAAVFLCTIGDIEDFAKTGNLAAYLGIVPRVSQSNDSQRVGRITKRGNKIARTTLVQCTLIAKRYSPYLRDFYEHIKKTRGSGKAIIATARKLLNTIFYTLKKKWVFEDFTNFKLKT